MLILAQTCDDAVGTFGIASLANIAPMEDQPVMGVEAKFWRNVFFQGLFDLQGSFARSKSRSVGDAEDMCIYGHGGFLKGDVAHHVGGFASNTGKVDESLGIVGDLALVPITELPGELDDVGGLGAKEANGLDVGLQLFLSQGEHFFRCVSNGKERGRSLVDTLVGGLGGKNDRHEEGVGIGVVKLAFGLRALICENLE